MNISAPFIRRPIGTTLLTIALALAGLIAYQFLPVAPLPQVEFPTMQVEAHLPGASPEIMASAVATPLERQFGRMAGLNEMTSTSYLGSTTIALQFDLSRNIDAAARDVQAAINAARGQLPANLPSNPFYRKTNPADSPVLILSLTAVNTGRMFVALKPLAERQISADQVMARLRGQLACVPGARLFMQVNQELRMGGRPSGAQYQFTLQGDNIKELNAWAPRVLDKIRTLPILTDVNSDQQDRGLETSLAIDRSTASRLGVSTAMLDDTLYDAFGQRQVSTMYTQLNQYHVVLEVEPLFWQNSDGLKYIYARSANSSLPLVPLSAFTHYAPATTALAVNHQGQFPAVTISFNLAPGAALGDAVAAITQATSEIGLPSTMRGSFHGIA